MASGILWMDEHVVHCLVVPFRTTDVRNTSAVKFTSNGIDSSLLGYKHPIDVVDALHLVSGTGDKDDAVSRNTFPLTQA